MLAVTLWLSGCAPMSGPPSPHVISRLETLRVLEARADSTRLPGKRIAEFAPTVEVRNVACRAVADSMFDCEFETRVVEFLGDEGAWEPRSLRLRSSRQGWRPEPS